TPEQFKGWAPTFFLGTQLSGKTLGIIGLGRIGQAVAKRAAAFGMKIIYSGHHPKEVAKEWDAEFVSQAELLKRSDVVTIHAAYSPLYTNLSGEELERKVNDSWKEGINYLNGQKVSGFSGATLRSSAYVASMKDWTDDAGLTDMALGLGFGIAAARNKVIIPKKTSTAK
ncbi:NAD(P)-dependent oxidoreductase, partial [Listeria monocytogenes]|uniref:NAD(P)-dependent oxidoreductase n=1 Tax=Listeria monocytogenes TaxID=1639 RepID=UPI0032047CCD